MYRKLIDTLVQITWINGKLRNELKNIRHTYKCHKHQTTFSFFFSFFLAMDYNFVKPYTLHFRSIDANNQRVEGLHDADSIDTSVRLVEWKKTLIDLAVMLEVCDEIIEGSTLDRWTIFNFRNMRYEFDGRMYTLEDPPEDGDNRWKIADRIVISFIQDPRNLKGQYITL